MLSAHVHRRPFRLRVREDVHVVGEPSLEMKRSGHHAACFFPGMRALRRMYYRFPILAAFANGIGMVCVAGWNCVEAIRRLREPVEVLATPMLVVAAIILRSTWFLLRDSGHILHEGTPVELDARKIGFLDAPHEERSFSGSR